MLWMSAALLRFTQIYATLKFPDSGLLVGIQDASAQGIAVLGFFGQTQIVSRYQVPKQSSKHHG
jgi:hypothetical protein